MRNAGQGETLGRHFAFIDRLLGPSTLPINLSPVTDFDDENDQAPIFNFANQAIVPYTVFPEFPETRSMQRLS